MDDETFSLIALGITVVPLTFTLFDNVSHALAFIACYILGMALILAFFPPGAASWWIITALLVAPILSFPGFRRPPKR